MDKTKADLPIRRLFMRLPAEAAPANLGEQPSLLPPLMKPTPVLSKSVAFLRLHGGCSAGAFSHLRLGWWRGTGDLATLANSNPETTLPSPITPDTMRWDGTAANPLALTFSTTAFAGTGTGLVLDITAGQTSSLNIDATATNSLRMNTLTIAAGAGAFSIGNNSGPSFTPLLGSAAGQTHTWTNSSSNAVTFGSEANFSLGGGGAHTLALNGVGGYVFNSGMGQGNGTLTINVAGNTTATFNAMGSYSGATNIGGTNTTGIVKANANNALGTGTIVFGNNATNARLELIGGSTLSNAITFAGRTTATNNTTAIQSVSGANTLAGTLTLTTGGGTYRIQADAGSSLTLSNAISIAGATISGARTVTLAGAGSGSIQGAITNGSGTVAITKADAGTWTFSGANSYTGNTTVSAGMLITSPAQTGATTVTVADGAAFGVKLATPGTTFNVATLNTGTTTGATLVLDTGALGTPTAALINATTFTPAAATLLSVPGTALAVGNNIPLLDYSGTIGGVGFAGLSLALPTRTVGNLVDNTNDTRVDLNITQLEQVKWHGSANGQWDADTDGTGVNGTQNWLTTVKLTPTKYLQGTGGTDTVNFTESAMGPTDINIASRSLRPE